MEAVALDLDGVLGDTRALWRDWIQDAARRYRMEELEQLPDDRGRAAEALDTRLGNWRELLERFAQDHAPVYLRPNAGTSAALRRLQADGVRIGIFTDAPEPLARVALSHLGAARRLDVLETGPGAFERLLERLGSDAVVVHTRDELVAAAA